MKAIVFGAGKIARGFIGQLLYLSGFETIFIDVNQELIDKLNKDKSYHVYILGDSSKDSDVTNFQAIHLRDTGEIQEAMRTADIAFVSVGGQNLVSVGARIAEIYNIYGVKPSPFNFVTCENWKDAGDTLRSAITSSLSEEIRDDFNTYVGVNEAVIMRSATQPSEELAHQDPTGVWVQNYWYLPISAEHFKGDLPSIIDTELMQNFGSFLTQKMYTNNTSNAVIAYNGYLLGYDILAEAANSREISDLLDQVYPEINETLIKELHLDPDQQEEFARKARAKYTDWTIVDRVIRHGKDPIRKLGPSDRLIAPARMAIRQGIYPRIIIDTIAKALFFDEPSDEAAMKLKKLRQEQGIPYVLKEICELQEDEPLYEEVIKAVERIRTEGLVKGHE